MVGLVHELSDAGFDTGRCRATVHDASKVLQRAVLMDGGAVGSKFVLNFGDSPQALGDDVVQHRVSDHPGHAGEGGVTSLVGQVLVRDARAVEEEVGYHGGRGATAASAGHIVVVDSKAGWGRVMHAVGVRVSTKGATLVDVSFYMLVGSREHSSNGSPVPRCSPPRGILSRLLETGTFFAPARGFGD